MNALVNMSVLGILNSELVFLLKGRVAFQKEDPAYRIHLWILNRETRCAQILLNCPIPHATGSGGL